MSSAITKHSICECNLIDLSWISRFLMRILLISTLFAISAGLSAYASAETDVISDSVAAIDTTKAIGNERQLAGKNRLDKMMIDVLPLGEAPQALPMDNAKRQLILQHMLDKGLLSQDEFNRRMNALRSKRKQNNEREAVDDNHRRAGDRKNGGRRQRLGDDQDIQDLERSGRGRRGTASGE